MTTARTAYPIPPEVLVDRVRELAKVPVDLVRVVAAPGGGEVLALDEVTLQLHEDALLGGRVPRRG